MSALLHFCQDCDWQGREPQAFDQTTKVAVALALEAGQVMPSGHCPKCAGRTLPDQIHRAELAAGEAFAGQLPADAQPWSLSVNRIGQTYVFHLQHPRRHGCEVTLEVIGERPTLSVTPWSDPGDIGEAEPLALIKVGDEEVLVWNGRQNFGRAVALRPDGNRAGPIMDGLAWLKLAHWSEALQEPAKKPS